MPVAVRHTVLGTAILGLAVASLTGCAKKSEAAGGDAAAHVTARDDSCTVSKKHFPAGRMQLSIANEGSKVTEVYVLFPDDRIVTERENIGPGTRATLSAEVKAGNYEIACKPGMKGDGIRQKITVSGGKEVRRSPAMDRAVAAYRKYVQRQADETLPKAKAFTDAVRAGDLDAARAAYAPSRLGWERTEPVAESFGDIDPKVDVRADGLEQGQKWTGWHRLEKALWQDDRIGAREKALATTLDADLTDWDKRVGTAEITPTSMAEGAKGLLDEVASSKVTGEEERYSHTDLVDFKGNLEGAQEAYELLRPLARKHDAALVSELDRQFAALTKLLDGYRTHPDAEGDDAYVFTPYDKVAKADRKQLSDAVNALAEPLSKLAAAVVA